MNGRTGAVRTGVDSRVPYQYGYALAELDGIEGFEKFVASPQYDQWIASAVELPEPDRE